MTERRTQPPELPLETAEGRRAGGPAGDRLIVGIAAIALLGGVLIIAGKGLAGDPTSQPTSSAGSSAAAASRRPSTRPTASPRVVTVEDQPLPPPFPLGSTRFDGWIRAKADLPVYSSPSADSSPIGVLKKGTYAYAFEADPTAFGLDLGDRTKWLRVGYPEQDGFITGSKGATALVDRYQRMPVPQPANVAGLASSPDRLMTWGSRPVGADSWTPFLATSEDGASWRLVDMGQLDGYPVQAMAYGPAGWLALVAADDPAGLHTSWLLASADGLEWRVSGALDLAPGGPPLANLVGGPAGYAISVVSAGGPNVLPEVWQSTDGLTWTAQRIDPTITEGVVPGPLWMIAIERGLYAYTGAFPGYGDSDARSSFGGFSTDGSTWRWGDLPVGGVTPRVVALGKSLLAIDVSQVTGQPRVWTGTLDASEVTWTQDQAATALLHNTGVSSVTSNGGQAMVFGWETRSGAPVAYSAGSAGWRSVALPTDAFGGMAPLMVVPAPNGTFAAAGARHTLFADHPVFWRGSASGPWSAEEQPLLDSAASPSRSSCPPKAPPNAIAFNIVPSQWAVFCFGDQPMTFRAWVADCQDCYGSDPDRNAQPAWLLNPPTRIVLSAVDKMSEALMPATPAESLVVRPEWTEHWVEITGHYDDPASATCREAPDPRLGGIQVPRQLTIDQCRQQFVVTAVRLVDGPGQR